MSPDLHNSGKRILVRPHSIDRLLSSSGNAVITAIALVRTVGRVIRPFQLRKINILAWNVLHGRIRCFAKRQGVAGIGNHTARDGHDNASGIALDGNRMIWTWYLDLLFPHVWFSSFCCRSKTCCGDNYCAVLPPSTRDDAPVLTDSLVTSQGPIIY